MSTKSELLARALETSGPLFTRFLAGFDDTNRTSQAEGLPNHACWTLGHLALTLHRASDLLEGDGPKPLPEQHFVTADGRGGTSDRFDTESVCFGSTPDDEPDAYPELPHARRAFDDALARLAGVVRDLDDAQLERTIPWGASELRADDLVTRMVVHNGTHAGQLTDLRRALGLPSVIG